MSLIYAALAWLVGLLIADKLPTPMPLAFAMALLSGLTMIFTRHYPRLRLCLLVLACMAAGAGRMAMAAPQPAAHDIAYLAGKGEVQLVGMVIEDPQHSESKQRAVLTVERVALAGKWQTTTGMILVTLPVYPERHYGERLELSGHIKQPREAEQPGTFDYRQYLARRGIFSLSEPKTVRLLQSQQGNPLRMALLELRNHSRQVLTRCLPEPQAALAVGILLGLQSAIPEQVSEAFSITGTSHILVISGWNITIIATALYALAERLKLSKHSAFWVILITIWLYTLFVGASATVVRAAVMGSIVVLGQRLERQAHAWTTLLAASWAMTLLNPHTLWDLGFQLSALATASLFAFGKGTEALLMHTPLRWEWLGWAREALTATLAAQILALPLILYHFGNLSVIAPLANVVLLPVVPYAMLFGALALLGGLVTLPLGQVLAMPAYAFLAWLTEGARLFAEIPWAQLILPAFPLWMLLGYYALVGIVWATIALPEANNRQ